MTHQTLTGATNSPIMCSEEIINFFIAFATHIWSFVCAKRITLQFDKIDKTNLRLYEKSFISVSYK